MTDNERLRKWLDAAVEGAYCAGAEQERAAVVTWLRGRQDAAEWALTAAGYEHAADEIERGEHRRKGEP